MAVGRRRARTAAVLAGSAAWLAGAASALADSPAPSQATIGDPRAGQSAGFVGDPGLAIAIVVLLAVVSILATLAWIRATGGPRDAGAAGGTERDG
jgi:hypothetical protein